jgi:hypothetical protein
VLRPDAGCLDRDLAGNIDTRNSFCIQDNLAILAGQACGPVAERVYQNFKKSNGGRNNFESSLVYGLKEWLDNTQIAWILFDQVNQRTGIQPYHFALEVV